MEKRGLAESSRGYEGWKSTFLLIFFCWILHFFLLFTILIHTRYGVLLTLVVERYLPLFFFVLRHQKRFVGRNSIEIVNFQALITYKRERPNIAIKTLHQNNSRFHLRCSLLMHYATWLLSYFVHFKRYLIPCFPHTTCVSHSADPLLLIVPITGTIRLSGRPCHHRHNDKSAV